MILFQNNIIILEYDPATDILQVEYPNLHISLLPEIKHSITIMVDIIRNYDIKRLLLDSSRTAVSVSAEDSRQVAVFLASELLRTRIQRVGRLQSLSAVVETTAQENMKHISQTVSLPYQVQNFTAKVEAIAWLKESSFI